MFTRYGYGDAETWGPVIDPRDPRMPDDDDESDYDDYEPGSDDDVEI